MAVIAALSLGACSRGESVDLRTSDGFTLQATLRGDGSTGVVFAHHSDEPTERGGLFSGGMWHGFDDELVDQGHQVLVLDLRGQGSSEGVTDPLRLSRDITAAVSFFEDAGVEDVVVIGSRVAGAAALQASSSGEIAGVVGLSVTDEGNLDPLTALAQARTRFFFAAAVDDEETADFARQLLEASLDPDSGFHLAAGDARGPDLLDGRSGDRLKGEMRSWIAKVLG